ncbi:mitochondrial basic amino acids transporter-like isoform X2 [Panonychus citri]|uniref:mitochondrial basic amino acids transporter-like isoform X2 n=1 Tax=Panonychus citri TaxID=50023 RepID=UPI0023070511|nr:mitochondrial basic amino acids transporter-like isoform X2 [Panonychus citri]
MIQFTQNLFISSLGGLFSGLSSPLACLAFVNAIVFGVYGNLNEYLKTLESTTEPRMSKVGREFIAGTVSGVAQCLITCPMELVKCRMQLTPSVTAAVTILNETNQIKFVNTQNPTVTNNNGNIKLNNSNNIKSTFNTLNNQHNPDHHHQPLQQQRQFHHSQKQLSSMVKHNFPSRSVHSSIKSTNGQPTVRDVLRQIKYDEKSYIRGLYRGMIPTLLRDAPAFGIYFSSFQYLIDRNPEETSETKLLMAGGLAGALSWLFIYPIDVIKTKIQTEGAKYDHSLIKCTKSMYKDSSLGWRIFFRGFTPTLVRAFPVNAVTFYVVNKTFVLYENYL